MELLKTNWDYNVNKMKHKKRGPKTPDGYVNRDHIRF